MKELECELVMYPTVCVDNEEIVDKFLALFKKYENLLPEKWGRTERVNVKYKEDELKDFILYEPCVKSEIFLSRKKRNSYFGWTSIKKDSKLLSFNFSIKYPANKLEDFFNFADDMVELLNPIFCTASINNYEKNIEGTEYEKQMYSKMKDSRKSFEASFLSDGPIGLSLRTYCHKNIVEYFNIKIENLKDSSLYIKGMKNGGIRVDLVKEPWNADKKTVFENWINGMNYFDQFKLFAEVTLFIGENYIIDPFKGIKPSLKWKEYVKTL